MKRLSTALPLVAALVLLTAGCDSAPPPSVPQPASAAASARGTIAHVGGEFPDFDIYLVQADGTGLVDLSNNDDWDTAPVFSPNGKRIAFVSNRDSEREPEYDGDFDFKIYVMDADGTNALRLTDAPGIETVPSWSNDGRRIAFTSDRDDPGKFDIYVINANGTGLFNLTDSDYTDLAPAWSPSGRQIAFTSDRDEPGNFDLYVMDADGTNVRRLTDDPGTDIFPDWSPSGQQIIFQTTRNAGKNDIYLINADGTGLANLTDHPSGGTSGVWAPNGQHIAIGSRRAEGRGLFIMNADGTDATFVTGIEGSVDGGNPSDWSY